MRVRWEGPCRALWHGLLVLSLLLAFLTAWNGALREEEFPRGIDPTGYLLMAQAIRHAAATGTLPDFSLKTSQSGELIAQAKTAGWPVSSWSALVGPLGYHYQEHAGAVGCQYPPGTALMLACSPAGKAVWRLQAVSLCLLLALGIFLQAVCWRERLPIAGGFLALASFFSLVFLERIGSVIGGLNYSIAASLLLLVIGTGLLLRASERPHKSGLALGAGAFFGFAVLIRIASILIVPGLFILIWPHRRQIAAFLSGFILCGLGPLLFHQARVAGAWYASTYPIYDRRPPLLQVIPHNFDYYLGYWGGRANLFLFWLALGFLFLLLVRPGGRLMRGAIGAALVWLISFAYFLTHRITIPYYMGSAALVTVWILAGTVFQEERRQPFRGIRFLLLAAACLPGLLVLSRLPGFWRQKRPLLPVAMAPAFSWPKPLPEELRDPRAWIWADEVAGAFWYYDGKEAFPIVRLLPQIRRSVFAARRQRNEPQFLVIDDTNFGSIIKELGDSSATLVFRGEVFGKPYYKIAWSP